jgi:site-specific DNA-methyltransferase (adenine-specific)
MSPPWRKRVELGPATLYLGDCLAILPTLADVDGVVTDPPYSSGGAFRGDRASQSTHDKYLSSSSSYRTQAADFTGDSRDQRGFHFWSAVWSSAALRATRPGGIAAFFADWRQLPVTTDYLQAGGWVWRGVVPWVKPGPRPQMSRFAAQCEYLVWGSAGPLPVKEGVGCLPGFFSGQAPRGADRLHVTQKPESVMGEILAIVPPGGLVLDPFMGSATTGVAAIASGRRFIGIELSPEIFEVACTRLAAATVADLV